MSAMTIELAPTEQRSQNGTVARTGDPIGTRPATRPGRGSARGPLLRPDRVARFPRRRSRHRRLPVRGCVAEHAVLAARPTTWQLTDRGIAVVLVSVLMIVVAAVAVIGLTAFRVTGDNYQGYGQSQSAQN